MFQRPHAGDKHLVSALKFKSINEEAIIKKERKGGII